jgi:WD40 repeat protein
MAARYRITVVLALLLLGVIALGVRVPQPVPVGVPEPAPGPTPQPAPPPDTARSTPTFEDGSALVDYPLAAAPIREFGTRRFHPVTPSGKAEFFPDGKRLVTGGPERCDVRIWEVTTGKLLLRIATPNELSTLALAPDGATLAVVGALPAVVTVPEPLDVWRYDTATGREIGRARLLDQVPPQLQATPTPDGTGVIVGPVDRTGLTRYDLVTGQVVWRYKDNPAEEIGGFVLSPDGARIVVTVQEVERSGPATNGNKLPRGLMSEGELPRQGPPSFAPRHPPPPPPTHLRFIDQRTGADTGLFPHFVGTAPSVSISPDGKLVLVDGSAYDARTRERFETGVEWPPFEFGELATFSRDGRRAVWGWGGKRGIRIFDTTVQPWKEVTRIKQDLDYLAYFHPDYRGGTNVALSPDGATLAVCAYGVVLWDTRTGNLLPQTADRVQAVTGVHWFHLAPGGTAVTGYGFDQGATWDLATGTEIDRMSKGWSQTKGWDTRAPRPVWPERVPSSDGGRVALLGTDQQNRQTVTVIDPATGTEIVRMAVPETRLSVSPDLRTAVGMSWYQHQVRLYEIATGRVRHECVPVDRPYSSDYAGLFTPNGRYLITNTHGGPVMWDIRGATTRPATVPNTVALERAWENLDSDDAVEGFRAVRVLAAFPERALPFLESKDPPQQVRAVRAVEALEWIGTPRAARLIESWAPKLDDRAGAGPALARLRAKSK